MAGTSSWNRLNRCSVSRRI